MYPYLSAIRILHANVSYRTSKQINSGVSISNQHVYRIFFIYLQTTEPQQNCKAADSCCNLSSDGCIFETQTMFALYSQYNIENIGTAENRLDNHGFNTILAYQTRSKFSGCSTRILQPCLHYVFALNVFLFNCLDPIGFLRNGDFHRHTL